MPKLNSYVLHGLPSIHWLHKGKYSISSSIAGSKTMAHNALINAAYVVNTGRFTANYPALDLLQSGLDPHQVALHGYLSEETQHTQFI